MNEYYTAEIFLTVVLLSIMIAFVKSDNHLSKDPKRGYILAFIGLMIVSVSEYLGVFLDGKGTTGNMITLHYFVKFVEFCFAPCIPVIIANTVIKTRKNERRVIECALILHIVLEGISLFSGIIFYIDGDNIYHRADFYNIYLFISLISILYMFFIVWKSSQRYQNSNAYILLAILVLITAGVAIQAVKPELRIIWITISIATTLIYIYHNRLLYYIDGLTQLLNQKSFFNYTSNLRDSAIVIVFDIDQFKEVNDKYGHQYGNECIVMVSKMIKKCYGNYGLCYRIGGDEFAVVTTTNFKKLDELNSEFEEMQKLEGDNFPTVSRGYAVFNPEYDIISDVIEEADKNMYDNKKKKKLQE